METFSTRLKPEAGNDRNGVRFNYQLQLVLQHQQNIHELGI